MTKDKEQVIAMAREAGVYTGVTEWTIKESETFVCGHDAIHRFATLVGNAKLEEAAKKCDDLDKNSQSQWPQRIATIVRNMKAPTT